MKIAPIAEVKTHLSRLLDECRDEPLIVTRNGRAAALLVAITDDEDLETLLLSHSRRLRRIFAESQASIERGEGLEHEEFWAAVESPRRGRPRASASARGRKRR